jgi:transposase
MSKNRRKYDEEFKKRAVHMSYSSERSVTEVAKSLGIIANMIYLWCKKFTSEGDKTRMTQQKEDMNQLRSRIAELEEENYILKKSVGLLREKSKVTVTDYYSLMEKETHYAK